MPESAPTENEFQGSSDEKRARILVVDDNAPDVMLIDESLRDQEMNFDIVHMRDGEEALARLASSPDEFADYSLIVLDLNMPRVGGREVLSSFRASAVFGKVPVLVLTSSLAPEEQDAVRELGADRYLDKPAHLDEFLTAVGSAIKEMARDRN